MLLGIPLLGGGGLIQNTLIYQKAPKISNGSDVEESTLIPLHIWKPWKVATIFWPEN